MHYDLFLDASELRCPIPIIRTKSYMSKLTKGQILLVVVTDPSYLIDCEVYIRQSGHSLLQTWQEEDKYFYRLQHT